MIVYYGLEDSIFQRCQLSPNWSTDWNFTSKIAGGFLFLIQTEKLILNSVQKWKHLRQS